MPRSSRIIVADADNKHAQLLAFGFEREGLVAQAARTAEDVKRHVDVGDVVGVVLSLPSPKLAVDALRRIRGPGPHLPVVALGDPGGRTEVLAAGATDYLPRPAFVRDVVALLRFHGTARAGSGAPTAWTADLSEFAGTLYLVRALASAGRTGVMTIVRGLRRAELRFHEGEVTSAQVGALHGLGALHQILLWTEGKLDFRTESVVRRNQIPLSAGELFDDLGRFLREFHDLAPELSPGVVLAQDLKRVSENVDKIPKEVSPVLRLFDGARLLSDVIEDAPFRVFDTLKITTRLVKLGVVHPQVSPRARGAAALKVDDWLVGTTPPVGVPSLPMAKLGSEPMGPAPGVPASPPAATIANEDRRSHKKRPSRERAAVKPLTEPPRVQAAAAPGVPRAVEPAAGKPGDKVADDWGPLAGTAGSIWDLPSFAPVVPSQVATGEIRGGAGSNVRPEPEHVAAAGKVIAEDLVTAPRTTAVPGLVGTARERVDEISAPMSMSTSSMPVVTIMPAAGVNGRPRAPSTPPRVIAPPAPVQEASIIVSPIVASADAQAATGGELLARDEGARVRPSQEIASIIIEADEPPPEADMTIEAGEIEAPSVRPVPTHVDVHEPQVLVSLPEIAQAAAIAASVVEIVAIAPPILPVAPQPAPPVPATSFTRTTAPPPVALPSVLDEPVAAERPRRTTGPPPVRARRSSAPPISAAQQNADDAADAAARALAFDDIDEEFFSQESKFAEAKAPPVESFEDLEPSGPARRRPAQTTGFWKKLFGQEPPPAPTPAPRRRPTTVPPPGNVKKK